MTKAQETLLLETLAVVGVIVVDELCHVTEHSHADWRPPLQKELTKSFRAVLKNLRMGAPIPTPPPAKPSSSAEPVNQ